MEVNETDRLDTSIATASCIIEPSLQTVVLCLCFVQRWRRVCFPGFRSAVREALATVPLLPHHPQRVLQQAAQTWQEDHVSKSAPQRKSTQHDLRRGIWRKEHSCIHFRYREPIFSKSLIPNAGCFFSPCLCLVRYSYLQRYTGEQSISNREDCWMPLIYYRASLQGTAEGEDAVSFISSDTNKQLSLTNRSRSPSIKPAASEGTSHSQHWVSSFNAVLLH